MLEMLDGKHKNIISIKTKKNTFQNITKCIHRLQCVQDILGATNPCINCICEIIDDICGLFGCDLNCHPTTVSPH